MTLTFLKKLGLNLFQIMITAGLIYSFAVVGERWLGDSLYGLLIFLIGMLTIWILERSYRDAKREHDAEV